VCERSGASSRLRYSGSRCLVAGGGVLLGIEAVVAIVVVVGLGGEVVHVRALVLELGLAWLRIRAGLGLELGLEV
jgi:hypothetical protein